MDLRVVEENPVLKVEVTLGKITWKKVSRERVGARTKQMDDYQKLVRQQIEGFQGLKILQWSQKDNWCRAAT